MANHFVCTFGGIRQRLLLCVNSVRACLPDYVNINCWIAHYTIKWSLFEVCAWFYVSFVHPFIHSFIDWAWGVTQPFCSLDSPTIMWNNKRQPQKDAHTKRNSNYTFFILFFTFWFSASSASTTHQSSSSAWFFCCFLIFG